MKNANHTHHMFSALIFCSALTLSSNSMVYANEFNHIPIGTELTTEQLGGQKRATSSLPKGHQVSAASQSQNNNVMAQKVNINQASYAQLISLSGIGRIKAMAILKYRKEVGMFKTLEDIQNIKGIGEKLFNRLQGQIKI